MCKIFLKSYLFIPTRSHVIVLNINAIFEYIIIINDESVLIKYYILICFWSVIIYVGSPDFIIVACVAA